MRSDQAYSLHMTIMRSGPPTTHDCRLWRIPLTAPTFAAWQEAFQSGSDATSDVRASGVQFERAALTFRSDEAHVPEWIEAIDRWIAGANQVLAARADGLHTEAARAQAETDARRRRASDANEKFKNL
jgi:hypothetical protein